MPNTIVRLGNISGNSLIFQSIPNTYTDLMIVASIRDLTSGGGFGQTLYMQFNSDGSTLYSSRWVEGNGSSTYSGNNGTNQTGFRVGVVNSTGATSAYLFGNLVIYIPNYSSTTQFKSYVCEYITENGAANQAYAGVDTGVYRSTNAISGVSLGTGFSLDSNCNATLYGIIKS